MDTISMQYGSNYSSLIQSSCPIPLDFCSGSVSLLSNSVIVDYMEMRLCSLSEPRIENTTALFPRQH